MSDDISLGSVGAEVLLSRVKWNASVKSVLADTEKLQASFDKLTFNPRRIIAGVDAVKKALAGITFNSSEVVGSLGEVVDWLGLVKMEAGQAKTALKGFSIGSGSLKSDVAAINTSLKDVTAQSKAAKTALSSVKVDVANILAGSDAFKTLAESIGITSRAAGGLKRSLGGLALPTAEIVAGANEAAEAVGKLAEVSGVANRELRGLRVPPVLGGGRRGGGGSAEEGFTAASALKGGANIAAILTAGAFELGKKGADFDAMVQRQAANANMTPGETAQMRDELLRQRRRGFDFEEAGTAYRTAYDFGYRSPAQVSPIMNAAGALSIGTGAKLGESIGVLAKLMTNLHVRPMDAEKIVVAIHQAADFGAMTVQQLLKNSQRTIGYTSAFMPSKEGLAQSLAALTTLTRVLSPARADTQMGGLLTQIASPTSQGFKEAKTLGISKYFNAPSMNSIGLMATLDAISARINQLPAADRAATTRRLLPAKQGNLAFTLLEGPQRAAYGQALNSPTLGTMPAITGKVDFVQSFYKQMFGQPSQQMKMALGNLDADATKVGTHFEKDFLRIGETLIALADDGLKLFDAFSKLPLPIKDVIEVIGGLRIAAMALETVTSMRAIIPLGEKFAMIFRMLPRASKGLLGAGAATAGATAGAEGAEGVAAGAGIAGLAPQIALVTAAVVAFSTAYKTNFAGLRDITNQLGKSIKSTFAQDMPEVSKTVKTTIGIMNAWWSDHGKYVQASFHHALEGLATIATGAMNAVGSSIKMGFQLINGNFSGAWATFKTAWVNDWKALRGIVGNATQSIFDYIKGTLGKNLVDEMSNIGKDTVKGLTNGLISGANMVSPAAGMLAQVAVSAAKLKLRSHSPSKVFHEIGMDIAEGLAQGIDAGSVRVSAAIVNALRATIGTTNKYGTVQARAEFNSSLDKIGIPRNDKKDRLAVDIARREGDAGISVMGQRIKDKAGAAQEYANKLYEVQKRLKELTTGFNESALSQNSRESTASIVRADAMQRAGDEYQSANTAIDEQKAKVGIDENDTMIVSARKAAGDAWQAKIAAAQREYEQALADAAEETKKAADEALKQVQETRNSYAELMRSLDRQVAVNSGAMKDTEAQRAAAIDGLNIDYALNAAKIAQLASMKDADGKSIVPSADIAKLFRANVQANATGTQKVLDQTDPKVEAHGAGVEFAQDFTKGMAEGGISELSSFIKQSIMSKHVKIDKNWFKELFADVLSSDVKKMLTGWVNGSGGGSSVSNIVSGLFGGHGGGSDGGSGGATNPILGPMGNGVPGAGSSSGMGDLSSIFGKNSANIGLGLASVTALSGAEGKSSQKGDIIGSLLGLAVGSMIPGAGGLMGGLLKGGVIGGLLGKIFHFADGGTMLPNRPAFVAEAGTGGELVMPGRVSTAIPIKALAAGGLGRMGGVTFGDTHVHVHGDVNNMGDIEEVSRQVSYRIKDDLRTATGGY